MGSFVAPARQAGGHRPGPAGARGLSDPPQPRSRQQPDQESDRGAGTERGGGFAWAENSYFFRLTPWYNDPVSDPPGETLYVRDEESGQLWGPTGLPIREAGAYVVRHGQGYSRFEHTSHGVALDLLQYVPLIDPIAQDPTTQLGQGGLSTNEGRNRLVEIAAGQLSAAGQVQVATGIDMLEIGAALFAVGDIAL